MPDEYPWTSQLLNNSVVVMMMKFKRYYLDLLDVATLKQILPLVFVNCMSGACMTLAVQHLYPSVNEMIQMSTPAWSLLLAIFAQGIVYKVSLVC